MTAFETLAIIGYISTVVNLSQNIVEDFTLEELRDGLKKVEKDFPDNDFQLKKVPGIYKLMAKIAGQV